MRAVFFSSLTFLLAALPADANGPVVRSRAAAGFSFHRGHLPGHGRSFFPGYAFYGRSFYPGYSYGYAASYYPTVSAYAYPAATYAYPAAPASYSMATCAPPAAPPPCTCMGSAPPMSYAPPATGYSSLPAYDRPPVLTAEQIAYVQTLTPTYAQEFLRAFYPRHAAFLFQRHFPHHHHHHRPGAAAVAPGRAAIVREKTVVRTRTVARVQ